MITPIQIIAFIATTFLLPNNCPILVKGFHINLLTNFFKTKNANTKAYSDDTNSMKSCDVAITIIEDQNTKPSGLFIYTTEYNYAIFSPNLTAKNWQTVSVNDQSLSIISLQNKTLVSKLSGLSELTKLHLSKIQSNFNQNLAGLSFTSCSSTYGSADTSSGSYSESSSYSSSSSYESSLLQSSARQLPIPPAVGYNGDNNYGFGLPNSYEDKLTMFDYHPTFVYNNLLLSSLNDTLDGDVYQLCLYKPFLDIYSSTVQVRHKRNLLLFYRDRKFFAYRRPNMPLNINTFFLNGNIVFFIYNDKTISVKNSLQLNGKELDLVLQARASIKGLQKLEDNAIQIQNDNEIL